jgi:hypothetical protein
MIFAVAVIAVLVLLAITTNRNGKRPVVGALLWMCAITVLVWAVLLWRTLP